MPTYRIECASSSRAGCKNKECQDKKEKIPKGELRFGSWIEAGTFQSWAWKHWGCVTPRQIASLKEVVGDDMDFDSLDGYDELSSEQQQKVREAVERGHVADEDWKGDVEMNRPGQSGFRVKAPKKAQKDKEKDDEEDEKDEKDETQRKAPKGQKRKQETASSEGTKEKPSKRQTKPSKARKKAESDDNYDDEKDNEEPEKGEEEGDGAASQGEKEEKPQKKPAKRTTKKGQADGAETAAAAAPKEGRRASSRRQPKK